MDLYNAKMKAAGCAQMADWHCKEAASKLADLKVKWDKMKEEGNIKSDDYMMLQEEIKTAELNLKVREAYREGVLSINLLIQDCK